MSREQERIRKNLEKNPVAECNKIQKKYYPMLFEKFAGVKDPRHQSYIEYITKTMLGTLYYKCLGGIESMREMTRKFNDEQIVENLYLFLGERKKEFLPHGVTENEFLEVRECPMHGGVKTGVFPANIKAAVQYGKNLQAMVVDFNTVGSVSINRTHEILSSVFNIPLAIGTIKNMVTRCADSLKILMSESG